MRQCCFSARN